MDGVSIRILKEDGRSQYTDTQRGWTESTYGGYSRRMDGVILQILREDGRIHFTDPQGGWTDSFYGYSARMDGVNRKILK